MQLQIEQALSRTQLPLQCARGSSVASLYARVARCTRRDLGRFTLVHGNAILSCHSAITLAEAGLRHGTRLILVPRMAAGQGTLLRATVVNLAHGSASASSDRDANAANADLVPSLPKLTSMTIKTAIDSTQRTRPVSDCGEYAIRTGAVTAEAASVPTPAPLSSVTTATSNAAPGMEHEHMRLGRRCSWQHGVNVNCTGGCRHTTAAVSSVLVVVTDPSSGKVIQRKIVDATTALAIRAQHRGVGHIRMFSVQRRCMKCHAPSGALNDQTTHEKAADSHSDKAARVDVTIARKLAVLQALVRNTKQRRRAALAKRGAARAFEQAAPLKPLKAAPLATAGQ